MQTAKKITNAIKIELTILGLSMAFLISISLLNDLFSIWNITKSIFVIAGCLFFGLKIMQSPNIISQKSSLAIISTWIIFGLFILHDQIQLYQLIHILDLYNVVKLFLGIEILLASIGILIALLISTLTKKKTTN
jgi:hypothetical protein